MLTNMSIEQTGAGTYDVSIKCNSPEDLNKLFNFMLSQSPKAPAVESTTTTNPSQVKK